MKRLLIIFPIILTLVSCSKEEVQPPTVAETPEVVTVPDTGSNLIVSSTPTLPDPINPSSQPLLLKQLKNSFTMYINKEYVDTTVYHYNTNGEVVAEYSTYLNVGDSKIYSGYKKYSANPANINVPDKIYATVLTSVNNYTKTDFIYCDNQKRVIREVKDGSAAYSYQYDNQGRLSRKINEYNKEVTTYKYFSKNETTEANPYYLVQVFPEASTTASHEIKYVLSNTIKNPIRLNYYFNYGIAQEYAIEREIVTKGGEYSYSYILSDERVSEKRFKVGQQNFWIKFVY